MRKIVIILALILLSIPAVAQASVNVEISNNLEGSNNKVNVNSNTSGTVQNTTDIVINNNGVKKEYHGPSGNIELKSDDGKSSVNVSSSVNATTNITLNSNTDNSSASASPEASVAGVFKENSENSHSFWESILEEFSALLSLFRKHS